MNIAEMHVWFRQYAQQMGMQNVRAILPEQIDVLINTAISDTVNQLVRENVGVRNDRVITDNAKVGQINALRSLYKVENISEGSTDKTLKPNSSYSSIGLYSVNKFITEHLSDDIITGTTTYGSTFAITNVLYIVDLAIEYIRNASATAGNEQYTQVFPVRLIEDAYLADTLNDFVLKPRLRSPIAVVYQDKLDIYFGEEFAKANGLLPNANIAPSKLRVSYIGGPAKVKYASDLGSSTDNVNCDLPESMHVDILKHAVDLYNTSVNGGLYNNQQNQRAQQREIARNEARPADEGYQN